MHSAQYFQIAYVVVAGLFSLFFAFNAVEIFGKPQEAKPRAWWIYQYWFNFAGSVTGWIALWFLLQQVIRAVESLGTPSINWSDVALFFVAFVGVTGHLPYTVFGLINGIQEIAKKIAKWAE